MFKHDDNIIFWIFFHRNIEFTFLFSKTRQFHSFSRVKFNYFYPFQIITQKPMG